VFAAGLHPADDRADLAIVVLGFAIMRLAMVTQWLRTVSTLNTEQERCGTRAGRRLRLLVPERWFWPSVMVLMPGNYLLPGAEQVPRALGTSDDPISLRSRDMW
jgi:hypothetical protein